MIQPSYDNLTALAGGGQASATALREGLNRVTTVVSANDSVALPAVGESQGMELVVVNAAAANSMNVYPAPGQSINALGANTPMALAANKAMVCYCFAGSGVWHTILTA